jgi:hypothetical protein
MLSSVYQESSANNPRYAQIDPANRLLWRSNIRRLEFESLRDSLLAIGGTLDTNMFGRPVDLDKEPYSTRRTIYGYIDRSDVSDVLINFDFANPDLPSGRRHETTVPQQALFLMNSPLVIETAKKLVSLPEFTSCADDESRIDFLYSRIWQRSPREDELKLGLDFVAMGSSRDKTSSTDAKPVINDTGERRPFRPGQGMRGQFRRGGGPGLRRRAPLKTWEEYAHALLQANETSFLN